MKARRPTALDIITEVAAKAVFLFLTVSGLIIYAKYEWMW